MDRLKAQDAAQRVQINDFNHELDDLGSDVAIGIGLGRLARPGVLASAYHFIHVFVVVSVSRLIHCSNLTCGACFI